MSTPDEPDTPTSGASSGPRISRRAFGIWVGTVAGVVGTAAVGSAVTDPDERWYRSLDLPPWQPPPLAFPIAWTSLYAAIAATCAGTLVELDRRAACGDAEAARERDALAGALAGNLVLNAGWSALFFGAHRTGAAAVESVALAASSADLVRRVARTSRTRALVLAPYAAWTAFASVLSTEIWRRNRRRQ